MVSHEALGKQQRTKPYRTDTLDQRGCAALARLSQGRVAQMEQHSIEDVHQQHLRTSLVLAIECHNLQVYIIQRAVQTPQNPPYVNIELLARTR